MEIELDPIQSKIIQREFIDAIKQAGLVLIPKDAAIYGTEFMIKQKAALSKKSITPYKIAKLKLLPGVTNLKTVKNMVQDGRISASEHYTDTTGKMYVLTSAIKRLRNE